MIRRAYLDALARRGINAVLLWSYIAITDQETEERIGYEAPKIWPWVREQGRFDLARFNEGEWCDQDDLVDFQRHFL